VKNVPGRKTDVADCQWLQYLHSAGLLRGSFRPPQAVCTIRSFLRHREGLVQIASVHVQHMQKALDQMNLQLHHVISDITGLTGTAIIEAILKGERDPAILAKMRDRRIKASEETIAAALVGDYRPEHLFTLRQSLAAYRHCQQLVAACDVEIEQYLTAFDSKSNIAQPPLRKPKDRHRPRRNELKFDLRGHLYPIFGVDLTEVPESMRSQCMCCSPKLVPTSHASPMRQPSFPGWGYVRTTASAEVRSCRSEPAWLKIVWQWPYAWQPNRCIEASPISGTITVECEPNSAHLRR
jgi:hypothetical protein